VVAELTATQSELEARTLEALDWDFVLSALARCASTAPGRAAAHALKFAPDNNEVGDRHPNNDELAASSQAQGG
jgi:hypothetical protein